MKPVYPPAWPSAELEEIMLDDVDKVEAGLKAVGSPTTSPVADLCCHVRALLTRVTELEETLRQALRFHTDEYHNRVELEREVERLRTGLGFVSQLLNGSGRISSIIATATLEGANLLDEDVAVDVCSGHWRKPK